ncbi:hypothetical protein EON65_42475 [archaeon]|nr:MAG: hypothetical protein EON65_42475 [archaeon]
MDELELLRNGRQYPEIKAGDSIQIEKLPFATSKEVDIIKGVVIAKTSKMTESSIYLANVSDLERDYCLLLHLFK